MINTPTSYLIRVNKFSILSLITIGILLNISASSVEGLNLYNDNFYFIKRHIVAILIGSLFFNLLRKLELNLIIKFIPIGMFLTTVSLFLLLSYGVVRGGSRRWVDLGIINFQPSEISKVIIILFIAHQISLEHKDESLFKKLLRVFLLPLLSSFFILIQPDFGSFASIVFIVFLLLLFSKINFFIPFISILISFIPIYLIAKAQPYRFERITTWLNGLCDLGNVEELLDRCFQLNQSRIAISSGGWIGLGPGTSRARWGSLPNAYSDFISSIIGEEYGFIGLSVVIFLYILLVSSIFLIALREKSEQKKLIIIGIGGWIFFQTIINLGGAVGIVPITGIVLPFISYGSSAMVSILIALGIMYSRVNE